MGRTFIRQSAQIRQSVTFDDTLTAGSTLQSGSTNIESDLNAVRSQLKRAIWDDGAGNWYDDIPTINSKKRAIRDLNFDLDDLEEKRLLFRSHVLTDLVVPSSQNYLVLSASGSETPTETAAVGAGTAAGAVVASLAGDVGSHALTEVSGPNTVSPKNLVLIRDYSSGQVLQSGSKDIHGLLQTETGVVDGDTFNDTTHQVQISFVIENGTGDDLIACPVADIEGKSINYAYVRRVKFDDLPETAFLSGVFVDQTAAASDVTLNNAIDNQVGAASQTDRNIDWRITDSFTLKFQTSDGGRNLFAVAPTGGGDSVTWNVDTFGVTNTNTATYTNGVAVDTGGTQINLGATAGQIDSAGALTLASAASADLTVSASNEIILTDGNKSGSTFGGSLKLSDTAQEWSDYETAFGEISLLKAISESRMSKYVAVVTTNIPADTNVTGAGGTPNLDAQLGDYSNSNFVTRVNIYVNGTLVRNGANSGANNDVYPGTSQVNGDLKFEFALYATPGNPDVITMEIFG